MTLCVKGLKGNPFNGVHRPQAAGAFGRDALNQRLSILIFSFLK